MYGNPRVRFQEVPPRRCNGDSITSRVATSHQSLKRGEKEKDWQPKLVSSKHEPMNSESEDAREPSSKVTSEIRLHLTSTDG